MKTVFFDLGNVLIFFSYEKMIAQMAVCTGLSKSSVQHLFFDCKIREQYETGQIDSSEFYKIFQSRSQKSFSLQEFLDAYSNIFTPNKALWPTVQKLKNQGIRLILLSNTSPAHFNLAYSEYPVLHLFDEYILSFEVGHSKPDPRIFQKALARVPSGSSFYTDDVPEFIASARKTGLDGEIFTDVPTLHRHLLARAPSLLL